MLKIKFTTRDIAAIAVCSALYTVFGYLTSFVPKFYGVAFLPAVVIPAVFAVLYGPWVGGISGAIGIFLIDMFGHGIPLLSLAAGVPPNFILFFLIGYLYNKSMSLKQTLVAVGVSIIGLVTISVVLLSDMVAFTGNAFSYRAFLLTFVLTILASLVIVTVVSVRWKEWRSYVIGAVVGQIAGGLLLAVTVWLVSPFFMDYFGGPFATVFVLPLFVWTIATEIPFILLAGPPIIKVVYRAFPTLRYRNKTLKG
ncbi:MAG: ECF transporter S component [Nitrososphaerota archaeon]|jgi:uncharacterized membrane protein|nr:ECF transporter S component [Nitrososphaerota archaeon]